MRFWRPQIQKNAQGEQKNSFKLICNNKSIFKEISSTNKQTKFFFNNSESVKFCLYYTFSSKKYYKFLREYDFKGRIIF